MSYFDLFRYGLINLWRRKTRTLLTALSVTIGVMCVVVLISIGLGYEKAYRESVEQMGSLTKIDVMPAEIKLEQRTALLNDKAIRVIADIHGVESVTPVLQSTAYIKSGAYVGMLKLYGIHIDKAGDFLLTPTRGKAAEAGIRMHPQLLLTEDVSGTFADPANDWKAAIDADGEPLIDPLNANIKLTFDYANLTGNKEPGQDGRALPAGSFYRLSVTGLCSTLNNSFTTSGFLELDRLQEWLDDNREFIRSGKSEEELEQEKLTGRQYSLAWVKVSDVDRVQEIATLLEDAGFKTYSLNDMLESVRTQSRQIQGMLGAIGIVAMLVSAICVANTMMMSITERTREVGLLKVLGMALRDISRMFLIEALIVGIIGGIAGLGLSYLMRRLLPVIFAGAEIQSVIPLWLALAGVAFSGFVALLSALIPALKAMRIRPNAAIRAE